MELNKKLDILWFFNGIAIFFIITYHYLGVTADSIGYLGMTLFTFSAGYKLIYNHLNELNQKIFLSEYFIKRCVRLYKAYLGYSLLILFPLLIITYLGVYFFHFDFPGFATFLDLINNLNIFNFIGFFLGTNPIAGPLWYLVALIGITSICFTVLYYSNIKWLFIFFIPFFLISLLIILFWSQFNAIQFESIFEPIMVVRIFLYLPYYIFGAYFAYNQHYQKCKWFQVSQFYFPIFFLILIAPIIVLKNVNNIPDILYFFCGFLFPFFLVAIFENMKKIKIIFPFIMFSGVYSFQIYLFHEPLILPIISRIINDILKINYFFMVIIIPIICIYSCVIVYKIIKKVHLNRLFE